jgi:hypothetical protein
MFPLALAGVIWGYNAVRMAQLSGRNNNIRKKESENEQKNLTLFHNCTFEDKRTYNTFNNCAFNIFISGGKNE